jgi:hypothetical protein
MTYNILLNYSILVIGGILAAWASYVSGFKSYDLFRLMTKIRFLKRELPSIDKPRYHGLILGSINRTAIEVKVNALTLAMYLTVSVACITVLNYIW